MWVNSHQAIPYTEIRTDLYRPRALIAHRVASRISGLARMKPMISEWDGLMVPPMDRPRPPRSPPDRPPRDRGEGFRLVFAVQAELVGGGPDDPAVDGVLGFGGAGR